MGRLVSNSEFCRIVGITSENSVREAIKRGRLKKCLVPVGKRVMLDFDIALQEWQDNANPKQRHTAAKLYENIHVPKNLPTYDPSTPVDLRDIPVTPKSKINPEVDYDVISTKRSISDEETENELERKYRSMETLDKEKLIIEIETKELNLKVLRQEVVKKSEIDVLLAQFAVQIRAAMMAIPEKIVDSLMACNDRHEMVQIMKDDLIKTLTVLSEWKEEIEE
jgi:hypothetical protein